MVRLPFAPLPHLSYPFRVRADIRAIDGNCGRSRRGIANHCTNASNGFGCDARSCTTNPGNRTQYYRQRQLCRAGSRHSSLGPTKHTLHSGPARFGASSNPAENIAVGRRGLRRPSRFNGGSFKHSRSPRPISGGGFQRGAIGACFDAHKNRYAMGCRGNDQTRGLGLFAAPDFFHLHTGHLSHAL